MSTSTSASLQHILISIEEYDRLKSIEKQYHKVQKGIEEKLQIPSKKILYYNISQNANNNYRS